MNYYNNNNIDYFTIIISWFFYNNTDYTCPEEKLLKEFLLI